MRRALPLLLCLLPLRALAQPAASLPATSMPATSMDVAPTLLQLKPGVPGLFYVTNHGAKPVTVEIAPMDWTQAGERDVLTPSSDFFASPPLVTIAPGARQSVRLLATPAKPGMKAWRLLVSELPDPKDNNGNVKVMLQFSVPVFAGAPASPPLLAWQAQREDGATRLEVANRGTAPVKLAAPALGGAVIAQGPLYVLPGARRSFRVPGAASLHVTAQEVLSGQAISADATLLP